METWLNSVLARTVITQVVQAVLGVILFFVFRYFAIIYQRKFLNTWSLSWIAFAVFMISTAVITAIGINQPYGFQRISLTMISMVGSYAHAAFIVVGSLELIRSKPVSRKQILGLLVVIVVVSAVLVLLRSADPDGRTFRYVVRVGIRFLIISVMFFYAGIITIKNPRFTKGIGQRILAGGFLTYAVLNLYYAFVVFYNVLIGPHDFPMFFGLIEMLCVCVIALGMALWLLEDERLRLKKANQQLDSFLYSVSHDLRAPIASILGLTNLARLESTDGITVPYINMIEHRIKKLDAVIGDILQLSRSAKSELKAEPVDFNALMAEIISDLKFNQGVEAIRLYYPSDPDYVFVSDRVQLKIILSNLLSNAVKYHRLDQADPYIKIEFNKRPNEVIITIRDNGEGIATENQDKIFDMFYRASTHSVGTGLGLYIVKESVTKLNGTITLQSQEGVGSTFTIVLPLQ